MVIAAVLILFALACAALMLAGVRRARAGRTLEAELRRSGDPTPIVRVTGRSVDQLAERRAA